MRPQGRGPKAVPENDSAVFKRVLYYAPSRGHAEHFLASLGSIPGCKRTQNASGPLLSCHEARLSLTVRHTPCEALEALHREYFSLVILDLRTAAGAPNGLKEESEKAWLILDKLDDEPDIELRYGFHRILVLVSGPDSLEVDDLIAALGARGVGRVMRDTATCHIDPHCPRLPHHAEFGKQVLQEVCRLTRGHREGNRALCCAGGGITGIYFELGVLKCLEDCLSPGALNSFDLYFGISAGAVVTGFLANGYGVDEVMAGIAGETGGRLPPFSLSLLRTTHFNLAGLADPLVHVLQGVVSGVMEFVGGNRRLSLETLFLEYTDLFTAPFNAAGFERMLQKAFSFKGATNDFRALPRPLYIGTTDQDSREHVLFGQAPFDDVPISKAIQASISINPFFCSTRIGERFFVDGAVTRTSNFLEAVKKGANLAFAVDPFVPYVSKRPGYAKQKGVLYNADQDIRTVSYTRFETTRYWVLRRHPDVSLYTFLPGNRIRKVMSVNPMDHRPYLQIWRGAYLSTLQRIQKVQHRMQGDLAFHGVRLDTARAEAVAARLDAVLHPEYRDFFPDGRVEVKPPVLTAPKVRVTAKAAAGKVGPSIRVDAA